VVRLALDEQIFAIQEYGGISRLFAELAKQYSTTPELDVVLHPMNAPIINRYVLGNPELERALGVWDAGHEYRSLVRYFTRLRPRTKVDVVHNTFYLPHGLAGYPGARRVVTVHDMIPELLPKTRRRLDFLTLKKRYVMTADHVICVSRSTRDDLLKTYGPIMAPITVVHHGVDPVFQPGSPAIAGLPQRYVLFVGNRGGYKDATVLTRAFATIAKQEPDLALMFVGGGAFTSDERAELAGLGIASRVDQISLADHDMPGAYGNALICVFPSRFEGFGLPALESMACGTPTVLARATSLPEVGADAALYFTPGDPNELAAVMSELLKDDHARQELRAAGLERARQFTWRKSAEQTAEVYHSLVR
jgi:glycosyltransferase involved in cell wall biosynthesis